MTTEIEYDCVYCSTDLGEATITDKIQGYIKCPNCINSGVNLPISKKEDALLELVKIVQNLEKKIKVLETKLNMKSEEKQT